MTAKPEADLGQLVPEVMAQLREAGLRLTTPRKVIIQRVLERRGAFSAEELLAEVRRIDALISLPTVYRTLSVLGRYGLVRRVENREGRQVFEAAMGKTTRAVVVCEDCGGRVELDDPCLDVRQRYLLQRMGYDPREIRLEVKAGCQELRERGCCDRCGPERGNGQPEEPGNR